MPPEFTALLGNLLRYAKYAIKTVNGVSLTVTRKSLQFIDPDKAAQFQLLAGAKLFQ